MNKIKLFLENKGHENPRACICIHMYAHACFRPMYACFMLAYACFMLAYAYMSMHMHVRVPEALKDKFSALKMRFVLGSKTLGLNVLKLHFVMLANRDQNV